MLQIHIVIGLKQLPVFSDALGKPVFLFSHLNPMFMILGGILAMVGHNWSVFLGFSWVAVVLQPVWGTHCIIPIVAKLFVLHLGASLHFTKLVSLGL